jgi:DNA-binding NarL/FixJ family response regulator
MAIDSRPRILLVDDHQLVRMGLAQLLTADGGFVVVGECSACLLYTSDAADDM